MKCTISLLIIDWKLPTCYQLVGSNNLYIYPPCMYTDSQRKLYFLCYDVFSHLRTPFLRTFRGHPRDIFHVLCLPAVVNTGGDSDPSFSGVNFKGGFPPGRREMDNTGVLVTESRSVPPAPRVRNCVPAEKECRISCSSTLGRRLRRRPSVEPQLFREGCILTGCQCRETGSRGLTRGLRDDLSTGIGLPVWARTRIGLVQTTSHPGITPPPTPLHSWRTLLPTKHIRVKSLLIIYTTQGRLPNMKINYLNLKKSTRIIFAFSTQIVASEL